MTDEEQIAQARVRAYLARRAIASGYDPEHIHGYDVSEDNPEGVSLTVSDLTALLDALEAAEAKLAGGVIAEYDDGSTVFLSGYAGGAAIGGAWSTLALMEKASDGRLRVREYKAQGDWRAPLAEIKGT